MLKQLRKNQGFSFVEVMMASLVLAIVATGIYAGVTSIRQPATDSTADLAAAHAAMKAFEQLRMGVDADTWSSPSSNLAVGNHPWGTTTVGSTTYNMTYQVTSDQSGGRNVSMTIQW
jgi:prepilin-type N-terminal cleavage/methylation domain-containing protein